MKYSYNTAWRLLVSTGLMAALSVGALAATAAEEEAAREQRIQWWREARFGMFIHGGLYAVPAGVWKDQLKWQQTDAGLILEVPLARPSKYALVYRIDFNEP